MTIKRFTQLKDSLYKQVAAMLGVKTNGHLISLDATPCYSHPGAILDIYLTGSLIPKYKLIYTRGSKRIVIYQKRLLPERSPIEELATGIHDRVLHDLTGWMSHRNFTRPIAVKRKPVSNMKD